MPSLRETKDHIASVRGTLKITSAMKLVASAKLRKAQRTIETLRPYEHELTCIYSSLVRGRDGAADDLGKTVAAHGLVNGRGPAGRLGGMERSGSFSEGIGSAAPESYDSGKVAVVAIASNSSLCGGFNANIARKVLELVDSLGCEVEVHSLGRKLSDAMRRAGKPSPADYSELVAHPSYEALTALARSLVERYRSGELSRVLLVYNHFISTAKHEVTVETYLPFVPELTDASPCCDASAYIVEPSASEVAAQMLPQLMMLKFYAAVLDSAASEHAARMLAMQAATDNANELLSQLTLEYNKARQQKITAEILDLVGGSATQ